MVKASPSVNGYETEPGQPRFREPDRAAAVDDPIRMVAAAVQSVLAEIRGQSRALARSHRDLDGHLAVGTLFSARHVEALPPGTRTIRVAPGTVVTPVARDMLKRLGVTVRPVSVSHSLMASARGEWAFAIEAETGITQALRRALLDDPRPWAELESTLEAVIAWLLVEPGRGALLITHDAAVAVWKSCQVPGVRAASAVEPADVGRALTSLGINLLVVEPAGKSISWMKQLGTAFRQAGAPVVPHALQTGGWR